MKESFFVGVSLSMMFNSRFKRFSSYQWTEWLIATKQNYSSLWLSVWPLEALLLQLSQPSKLCVTTQSTREEAAAHLAASISLRQQ